MLWSVNVTRLEEFLGVFISVIIIQETRFDSGSGSDQLKKRPLKCLFLLAIVLGLDAEPRIVKE
jgi:hypothetical protein